MFCILANFPEDVVEKLPSDIQTGVYYGWAQVDEGDVHKMVMSIGWNPYYKNDKKSMVRVNVLNYICLTFYKNVCWIAVFFFSVSIANSVFRFLIWQLMEYILF